MFCSHKFLIIFQVISLLILSLHKYQRISFCLIFFPCTIFKVFLFAHTQSKGFLLKLFACTSFKELLAQKFLIEFFSISFKGFLFEFTACTSFKVFLYSHTSSKVFLLEFFVCTSFKEFYC